MEDSYFQAMEGFDALPQEESVDVESHRLKLQAERGIIQLEAESGWIYETFGH